MRNRIKVLFLAANPVQSGCTLRLDEEMREIDKKVRIGTDRDSFELVSTWAVRPGDLQEALLRHRPHIVHFSGHGSRTDGIILENNLGEPKPVSRQALASLFRSLKENIQIVLLNACHSRYQAKAFSQIIDYTIGMNTAVEDESAIIFSSYFYQALSFGKSVKNAFDMAKTQIMLEGMSGFKIPALLVREGVNPEEPFVAKNQDTSATRDQTLSGYELQDRNSSRDGATINVSGGTVGRVIAYKGDSGIIADQITHNHYGASPEDPDRAGLKRGKA